jgi:transposase
MDERPLFPLPEAELSANEATRPEHARVRQPNRQQLQWMPRDLDAALPQDHPARAIWDLLDRLDLSAFYASIRAVLDGPGRPTTDPKVLLALWLLATSEGIGSARKLAQLCDEHDAYRWLCGGVPVNYHMLADFRTAQRGALDDLLTKVIGGLMAAGAVTLERVAQDGMRVRASAGAASFRRRDTLEDCLQAAREQVGRLATRHDDTDVTARQHAARERAARGRLARVKAALGHLPALQRTKDKQQQRYTKAKRATVTAPRVSTTDPDARVMKMPDGGFRPAYNVQFATDGASGVIVGVAVTNAGTDAGQAPPMLEQIAARIGALPGDYLMDGGFATREDITAIEQRGTTVYAPVRLPRNKREAERYVPRYGDPPEVGAWRQRMATEAAKTLYRKRGAIAEWTNAQTRGHGLTQLGVRGLANVTSAALLTAVTHNLLRWMRLST